MDVANFRRPAAFQGEDAKDTALCHGLFNEADRYIRSFDWCKSVRETYIGDCLGGIVAIVLFHIEPASADVDDWIWVVVGDLPPAYLAPAAAQPRQVLEDYIGQMATWVEAVRRGEPVNELIPVNASPTREWADALDSRLRLLRKSTLPHIGDADTAPG